MEVLPLDALDPFKSRFVLQVDGVEEECIGLVSVSLIRERLLTSCVEEMVLVEGCNPGLVDVGESCSVWQVPDFVNSVQLLLSQG